MIKAHIKWTKDDKTHDILGLEILTDPLSILEQAAMEKLIVPMLPDMAIKCIADADKAIFIIEKRNISDKKEDISTSQEHETPFHTEEDSYTPSEIYAKLHTWEPKEIGEEWDSEDYLLIANRLLNNFAGTRRLGDEHFDILTNILNRVQKREKEGKELVTEREKRAIYLIYIRIKKGLLPDEKK